MSELTIKERDDLREDEFYWIKYSWSWEVAKWVGGEDGRWCLPHNEDDFRSIDFNEIDERRIVRAD